ncbi:hypothetical protein [Pseudoalteromonas sp. SG44-8]|uniref:hypothetical protein n=1 Tax=Pseudoalteromonas sp. SG44-8 TaxID=2760958 RepID=UPI0015FF7F8C|nr:hypothetical protein [Pseudoalteromonas sp. SG44-8]MBB1396874.1 hypothetical protein [Pseudoalteromonas sp. SG44-8]
MKDIIEKLEISSTNKKNILKAIKDGEIHHTKDIALGFELFLDYAFITDNFGMYSDLVLNENDFINDIIQRHFYLSGVMGRLIKFKKQGSDVDNLVEKTGAEIINLIRPTSEKFDSPLPRHAGLELYVKELIGKEKYDDVKSYCDLALDLGWRGEWHSLRNRTKADDARNAIIAKERRDSGNFAEELVFKDLKGKGYEVLLFGKSRDQRKPNFYCHTLHDTQVGLSIIDVSNKDILQHYSKEDVEESFYPSKFDYSKNELLDLIKICKKKFPCRLRLADKSNAPCRLKEDVFDKSKLEKLKPQPIHSPFSGCSIVNQCQKRIGEISALYHGEDSFITNGFIKDNIKVHLYIRKFLSKIRVENDDFHGVTKMYKLKEHPGRYDFAAYKDGEYYLVEVKFGTSKLSYWQKIRLGLMKRLGHKVYIAKVVDYKSEIRYETPDIDVELPSNDEMLEVLSFVHPSEKLKRGINDVPLTVFFDRSK